MIDKKEEPYRIWINPQAGILSFHFVQGFVQRYFSSAEEQMIFARKMSRCGYRIQ
jgi:hypothetical protein